MIKETKNSVIDKFTNDLVPVEFSKIMRNLNFEQFEFLLELLANPSNNFKVDDSFLYTEFVRPLYQDKYFSQKDKLQPSLKD